MRRWSTLALAAALAGAACAPDLGSPVRVVVVSLDLDTQQYVLGPASIRTLSSVRNLIGGAAIVQGGGAVRVSAAAIAERGATVDSLRRQFITSAPGDVDLAYSLKDGVVYPENFESLELATAYYAIEQSRAAFARWGVTTLPAARLVARADILGEDGRSPLPRGETFYAPLSTYYLPATPASAQIPISMNLGATAHALGHHAVAQLAWGGAPLPPTDAGPPRDAEWNVAKHSARAMTEGIADFFGAAVTGEARWLDHSDQQIASARSLDQLRCGSTQMLEALPLDDAQVAFDPYPMGTVLAAALWEAAVETDLDGIAAASLAALPKVKAAAQAGGGKVGIADFLEGIASSAPDELKPVLCGLLLNRFKKLSVDTLPACPAAEAVTPRELCD